MDKSFVRIARKTTGFVLFTIAPVIAHSNIIDTTYGAGAGSFELGAFVSNSDGYMALAPGASTITGWTVGGPGDGVDWLTSPAFKADTGIHAVDLQHLSKSSISTMIPTNVGATYLLTFTAAAFAGADSTGNVSAGTLNQAFTAPSSGNYSTQAFGAFSMLFQAMSSSTTLTFAATGPVLPICSALISCYGPVVDSVSVTAVPEPNALAMLLAGVGVLAPYIAARRNASAKLTRDA